MQQPMLQQTFKPTPYLQSVLSPEALAFMQGLNVPGTIPPPQQQIVTQPPQQQIVTQPPQPQIVTQPPQQQIIYQTQSTPIPGTSQEQPVRVLVVPQSSSKIKTFKGPVPEEDKTLRGSTVTSVIVTILGKMSLHLTKNITVYAQRRTLFVSSEQGICHR